ncbi:MAG TPA: histidine phosphatase family protein [Verrucomicrobiae bacterium]|jgi:broad specificity phosphatase PhoE
MSRLILVRHAQAAFGSADYDQLSPVGEEQARRLGSHWAERAMGFDQVFVGPRRRHRLTAALVGNALVHCGRPWPEAVSLPELDEYAGQDVFQASLPPLAKTGFDPATLAAGIHHPPAGASTERLKMFQGILGRWVRGELSVPGVETWKEFRMRARRGLEKMLGGGARGRQIAVFTSSGPVAAALDRAFNLDDERMLEASWQLRNTAVSEFVFSGPRFSLHMFNALPHLTSADLITHI